MQPREAAMRTTRQAGGGRGQSRTGMAGPGQDFPPFAMLIALRKHVVTWSRAGEFSLLTDGSRERASPEPRASPFHVTAHVTRKVVKELRDPDAARAREASAKRIRRAQPEGADARFKRDFLDVSFGHSCGVCDRLWFSNSLVTISSIKNDQARANAIAVLQREFPASSGEYKICYSCKDSLVAGKVPPMSVSYGYTYPPKPDHLPPLNLVEERLIAPRLPFMSIRRPNVPEAHAATKGAPRGKPESVSPQRSILLFRRHRSLRR
ncbi:hypothetical protein HPB47_003699 [Ixodes persulcatus]|uniref:Uncharacterized protein n=1 Tax=Ixodes persulcatus TaxID=34615 RepID=A0AC60PHW6_IXOPE|nr:hypothetical protein HPB47_003699 [Ixodes persulcatus]